MYVSNVIVVIQVSCCAVAIDDSFKKAYSMQATSRVARGVWLSGPHPLNLEVYMLKAMAFIDYQNFDIALKRYYRTMKKV